MTSSFSAHMHVPWDSQRNRAYKELEERRTAPNYSCWSWGLMLTKEIIPRLKAGGEGDDRGWDDWMTSSTQ